jgi:hypothetical protein
MLTLSDQADIAKTYENCLFLLIFEGSRLTDVASGSLWKLRGGPGVAAGWLDGSCWLAEGPQILRPCPMGGKLFIRGGYKKQ